MPRPSASRSHRAPIAPYTVTSPFHTFNIRKLRVYVEDATERKLQALRDPECVESKYYKKKRGLVIMVKKDQGLLRKLLLKR